MGMRVKTTIKSLICVYVIHSHRVPIFEPQFGLPLKYFYVKAWETGPELGRIAKPSTRSVAILLVILSSAIAAICPWDNNLTA